jgi:GAF domain-containing protein
MVARLVAAAAAGAAPADLPRRLCAVVEAGMQVDGVTLSLLTDTPSRQLLGASNDAALKLEEIQFTVAEGPCITAAATGHPVIVSDLRRDVTPWPLFGSSMREQLPEVFAVYAFPLILGGHSLGSMDLLRSRPGVFDFQRMEREGRRAAAAVTLALSPSWTQLFTDGEMPDYEPVDVIGAHWLDTYQAIGVVAVAKGVTADDALALMRAEAFRGGRTLAEVTTDILNGPPLR